MRPNSSVPSGNDHIMVDAIHHKIWFPSICWLFFLPQLRAGRSGGGSGSTIKQILSIYGVLVEGKWLQCVWWGGGATNLLIHQRFPMGQMPCIADQGELEKPSDFKTLFSPLSSFGITWSVQTNPTNHSTPWGLDYATKTVPLNYVRLRFMLQRLTQKKCQHGPGVRAAILNIYIH